MREWLKNAVFYEIYPQSFNDSNGDGIGDFKGIAQKLDYIKEIGFTDIWMNPCFDSPFRDAGYDVRNYYETAERYGTIDDLKYLLHEAHKRGMHIILDLVAGHTSDTCDWFTESKKAEVNEYTHRYVWTDSVWKDVSGVSGIKGSLCGISDRDGSCGVNFFSFQPALNYGFAKVTESWQSAVDSEEARKTRAELLNIIRYWLDIGCDGFRVDMANSLVKNDDEHAETIKLWQEIFSVVRKEYPDAAFVSEWGEPAKALKGGFDMDFLLHLGPSHYTDMYHCETPYFSKDGTGSAKEFFKYYLDCVEKTDGNGLICLPSGNHDMPRVSHFCDEVQIKLVYAFMMSMPGVPFVYYGDEIGMKYISGITSVEGGFHRTGARTPMQWDGEPNAGFSTADAQELYIMLDPDENRPTVEKQLGDKNSILNELKKQISVRKDKAVLQESAGFKLLSDDYPLVYKRFLENDSILIAINPLDRECAIDIGDVISKEVVYSFNGEAKIQSGKLVVPPLCATYISIF